MDIVIRNKDVSTDKLDGEFHVPLSYGSGSNKGQWMACVKCGAPKYYTIKTASFICKKCNTYNGDKEACIKKFKEIENEIFKSAPAHVQTEEAKAMIAARDTMGIKAELFAKGVRRNTVGVQNYNKILKNTLKEYHIGKSRIKY